MKSIKSLFLLLAIAAACLTSCSSDGTSKSDMKRYRTEILRYFPYHIGDSCVYENAAENSNMILFPYNQYYQDEFPFSHLTICGAFDKCSFDARLLVNGHWISSGQKEMNIEVELEHEKGSDQMHIHWSYVIYMSYKDGYGGYRDIYCPITEVLSQFPDTITMPIINSSADDFIDEGAYIRLVKDHGLTDFSLDGTTVWHQVKK